MMDEYEMIELIKEYGMSHENFDSSFVFSIEEWLSEGNELTGAQHSALENIIEKFHMA